MDFKETFKKHKTDELVEMAAKNHEYNMKIKTKIAKLRIEIEKLQDQLKK